MEESHCDQNGEDDAEGDDDADGVLDWGGGHGCPYTEPLSNYGKWKPNSIWSVEGVKAKCKPSQDIWLFDPLTCWLTVEAKVWLQVITRGIYWLLQ